MARNGGGESVLGLIYKKLIGAKMVGLRPFSFFVMKWRETGL
jgi:hypothetical protein